MVRTLYSFFSCLICLVSIVFFSPMDSLPLGLLEKVFAHQAAAAITTNGSKTKVPVLDYGGSSLGLERLVFNSSSSGGGGSKCSVRTGAPPPPPPPAGSNYDAFSSLARFNFNSSSSGFNSSSSGGGSKCSIKTGAPPPPPPATSSSFSTWASVESRRPSTMMAVVMNDPDVDKVTRDYMAKRLDRGDGRPPYLGLIGDLPRSTRPTLASTSASASSRGSLASSSSSAHRRQASSALLDHLSDPRTNPRAVLLHSPAPLLYPFSKSSTNTAAVGVPSSSQASTTSPSPSPSLPPSLPASGRKPVLFMPR